MIELRHLRKEYEDITPLEDVNVTINSGDVISVIGPSGTGKSTLLRCINRLEPPAISTRFEKKWAWYSSPLICLDI